MNLGNVVCEKCHAVPGESYSFHYGKQTGETHQGNKTITTYRVEGIYKVMLCKKCISKYRISQIFIFLILFLITLSIVWLGFKNDIGWESGFFILLIFTLSCLGCLFSFMKLIYSLVSNEKEMGENAAISIGRQRMELLVYDKFWNSADFSRAFK